MPGQRHTQETKDRAYYLAFSERKSFEEVSRLTGVSPGTLRNWFGNSAYNYNQEERARVAREGRRKEKERLDARYARMVKLRMQHNMTNAEIAHELGIGIHIVWHNLGRTPRRLGGRADWPPEMHSRARYLRACGYKITEIAEITGVPRATVYEWVRGMPCDYDTPRG